MLDEFTGGATESRANLEVFTPPERSREAAMGPKGGAGPSPPPMEGDGDCVDFVLTLGGDGLLMYSNTLFRVSFIGIAVATPSVVFARFKVAP